MRAEGRSGFRRVAIVGNSGSGKTTLAIKLAERMKVPYVCSDAQIWGPNWTQLSVEQRLANFQRELAGERWTFDGNILNRPDRPDDQCIIRRVDTIVWIDLPRPVAFWQLLRRTVWRSWSKEPLWHGNCESWRQSFFSRDSILLWGWNMHHKYREVYTRLFNDPALGHITRIRLGSRAQVREFLDKAGRGE